MAQNVHVAFFHEPIGLVPLQVPGTAPGRCSSTFDQQGAEACPEAKGLSPLLTGKFTWQHLPPVLPLELSLLSWSKN